MRVLIGFDMDGVIIDSDNPAAGDWFRRVFTETLREFGIPQTEENARALYIKNMRDNAEAFCRRFGIDDPHLLWERREAHYVSEKLTALETGMIALYPDVVALEDLSREYPLALVSNSPQVVVDRVVSHFSLADIFRVWIGRGSSLEDLSRAKPAPDLLERMRPPLRNARLLRRRSARRRRGRPRRIAPSDPPHPQWDPRGYPQPHRIGRSLGAAHEIEGLNDREL